MHWRPNIISLLCLDFVLNVKALLGAFNQGREEYKQFFLAYHDTVARSVSVYQPRPSPCLLPRSGFTGQRIKPLTLLPASLLQGFQRAVLAKVGRA